MEKLSKMNLQEWLMDKEMPMEVAESFEGGLRELRVFY
jgi:hypothetical protein